MNGNQRPQAALRCRLAASCLSLLFIAALLIPSIARAQTAKVKLNSATADELASVPGISKRKAAKIIANRPYNSADDLKKAGFSSKQIDKLTPLVSFEAGSASAPAAGAASSAAPQAASTPETKAPKSKSSSSGTSATAQTPPSPGMVWATPSSKLYHVEGSRYYGNTKTGQWMTEADAIKAGYRKSKR
jgi:hypothetical protein